MAPFSGDPAVTWAMYCIGSALVAALLLFAEPMAARQREVLRVTQAT